MGTGILRWALCGREPSFIPSSRSEHLRRHIQPKVHLPLPGDQFNAFLELIPLERELKMNSKRLVVVALVIIVAISVGSELARSKDHRNSEPPSKQIVVTVGTRHGKNLQYGMESATYSSSDLNYALAELALQRGKDCQVAVVLDADAPIGDIQEVPAMAVRAGFTDIRVFAHWPKTGNMAEILFGPVQKYSKHPGSG
jgi:biopolymer transport protein ExbD